MLRYIRENIERNKSLNSNEWEKIFPDNITKFYFMFVSGSFKGDMSEKLKKIAMVHKVDGTAMSIVTALLVADKIKGNNITAKSQKEFVSGINNTEYKIV